MNINNLDAASKAFYQECADLAGITLEEFLDTGSQS